MGFNTRKKKEPAVPKKEASSQSPVIDALGTQKELSDAAENRKEIEYKFRRLKEKSARGDFNKKALENQAMIDKYKAMAEENADGEENENRSRIADYEIDMLTVPGGYYEDPSETNDVPRTNLDYYAKAVRILEYKFKETSSADAVLSGANRLEASVGYFLDALCNALEQGNALKANACIDMIKYVFVVGHRFEDCKTEEEREYSLKTKESVLQLGEQLIRATDQIFGLVIKYHLEEQHYTENYDKYVEIREKYDRECPEDVKQMIQRVGFKSAKQQFPVGDERRQYLDLMLELLLRLTPMLMSSMMLEGYMREIIGLKAGNDTLVFELRKAFVDSGKDFNFDEHLRILTGISQANIRVVDNANLHALMWANQAEETNAQLKRISEDIKLGEAVGIATTAVENYDYLQRSNEQFREQRERQKTEYEINQRKAQREKEQRKLEEREQYLEELRQMELEEERIKEEQVLVEEEIETQKEVIFETMTEPVVADVIDNREVIIEEA